MMHAALTRLTHVLVLLALLLPLAACGAGTGTGSAEKRLVIWYSTDDPVERTWSQGLARRFEASHPDVQVKLVDYSFEDLNTKLQLALSGGKPPDLAYVTPRGPGIPVYVGAHRLADLTSAARSHGWAGMLRPGLLADYNRPFSFLGAKPGGVVAVPTSLAAVAMLYNKRLLNRLHLSIPRTWTAFETALARAKAAGYTPIGIGNEDGWLGDDWYLTLVDGTLPTATLLPEQRLDPHFTFRQPPFLHAATVLKGWAKRGYLTKNFGGVDAQEGIDLFFHGKTLFQLVSSSQNAQILQDQRETRLPIGVFAPPSADGRGIMPQSGYEGWVIPRAGAHRSEAVAFIDELLSPATGRFLLSNGVLPAHRGIPEAGPLWLREYVRSLNTARPGLYLDAAPVPNLNATMEANVQLLLQGYEPPSFLAKSLQEVYASHGNRGSRARIDGEF